MAVKIRLMRVGKKKQPTYRVVVADGRSPRDGRFIEIIGRYAPREEPSGVEINAESALAWLRKGAQPTDRVMKLLASVGAVEKPVYNNPEKAKPKKKAQERAAAEAAKAPAEAA